MSVTTSPALAQYAHDRIVAGKEVGIRFRPERPTLPYQVRVHPAPSVSVADALAAIATRDDLVARRERGESIRRPRRTNDPTLGEACESFVAEQEARYERGEARESTPRYYKENTRVWRTCNLDANGEPRYAHDPDDPHREPFADLRLSELDPLAIGRWLRRVRSVKTPGGQADLDRQALIKVFDLAELNGAHLDPALRLIPRPPKRRRDDRRRRKTLRLDELAILVEATPAYWREVVYVAGRCGPRLRELTTLTDDRLDLERGTMFIPAEFTKEGRDKLIPLLPDEVRAMRRQLVARAPGTRLVAPKARGSQFIKNSHFRRCVWAPALKRAAVLWRLEHGHGEDVPTPFDGYQFRWLRKNAVSLMRRAGLEPELIGMRLGHNDTGELVLKVYREVDEEVELHDALADLGDSLEEAIAARRATRQAVSQ